MNDDRISKHIEFKDSLKAYKEYLSKLNMEAKKKLDNLNNKDLDVDKDDISFMIDNLFLDEDRDLDNNSKLENMTPVEYRCHMIA